MRQLIGYIIYLLTRHITVVTLYIRLLQVTSSHVFPDLDHFGWQVKTSYKSENVAKGN